MYIIGSIVLALVTILLISFGLWYLVAFLLGLLLKLFGIYVVADHTILVASLLLLLNILLGPKVKVVNG